jgi:hypothetical protein
VPKVLSKGRFGSTFGTLGEGCPKAVDNFGAGSAESGRVDFMSRPADPLPGEFAERPFSVARGAAHGITKGRLRGRDLVSPTSGVRATRPPSDLLTLADAYQQAFPEHSAFSHLTAARIHGLPLAPDWSSSEPLHVVRPNAAAPMRRAGVVCHRGLERRQTTVRHRLLVVAAADTWCDLAPGLPLDERVILADAVVNVWNGIPLDQLLEAVRQRGRRRGVRALREALPLIRTRSRSRMETVARLAFLRAGLPEPELNCTILDAAGEWLSCPDFVWRAKKVAAEYDGEHHRLDKRQWRSDHARRRAMIGEGWRLHVMTADDFAGPVRIERVTDAIAADLG